MDEKSIVIHIPTPELFSFSECHGFLDRGYDECLYKIRERSVQRLIKIENQLILLEVSLADNSLSVECLTGPVNKNIQAEITTYVSDWFDLDRDLTGFYRLLQAHPITKNFTNDYYGLRLMGIVDLFEVLCWCVIGQQINLTFAHQIKTRLVHHCGDSMEYENQTYYCFPTPQQILELSSEELADMKFSRQKTAYIKNIAQALVDSQLDKKQLLSMSPEQQIKELTKIKGIGPWTANYASMKCLRNMSCIAYGDTGLSSALHTLFGTDKKPSYDVIDRIFADFKSWESYLNFYLWRSLSES